MSSVASRQLIEARHDLSSQSIGQLLESCTQQLSSMTSISIVAVGDISFNGAYHELLSKRGPAFPILPVSDQWKAADLRFGNLESPITDQPRVSPKKTHAARRITRYPNP